MDVEQSMDAPPSVCPSCGLRRAWIGWRLCSSCGYDFGPDMPAGTERAAETWDVESPVILHAKVSARLPGVVATLPLFLWVLASGSDAALRPFHTSALVLCGVAAASQFIRLLPAQRTLQIDEQGFTFRTFFRPVLIRWTDVEEFAAFRIGASLYIGWNSRRPTSGGLWRRFNRWAGAGYERALVHEYSMPAERLASLLNAFRSRYS